MLIKIERYNDKGERETQGLFKFTSPINAMIATANAEVALSLCQKEDRKLAEHALQKAERDHQDNERMDAEAQAMADHGQGGG